jgi:uncharacterized protein RhaS with RHS repeats
MPPDDTSLSVNRYYDPATGQFLSVDPLVDETDEAYSYTGGDPVVGSDPSGLENGDNGDGDPSLVLIELEDATREIVGARDAALGPDDPIGKSMAVVSEGNPLTGDSYPVNGATGPNADDCPLETQAGTDEAVRELRGLNSNDLGNLGVNEAISEFEQDGGTVLAREVTIDVEVNGQTVRVRIDAVGINTEGDIVGIEAKNGDFARMTANQKAAYPVLAEDGGTGVGQNAQIAGLVGPIDPMSIYYYIYPSGYIQP